VTVQHLSTFRVEGMSGPRAGHAVRDRLSALSGVRDVHVALDRREVTVLSDRPLPPRAVAAAIGLAGSTLALPDGPGRTSGGPPLRRIRAALLDWWTAV
jgi:hypothetical protein